jgi:hypothetical protein
MNCQRFEDVVSEIARDQIIDAGTREEVLQHSDDCESCAGRLEDERAITLSLRGLAENTASAGAPARVEERLLAAFDELALAQFPALPVSAERYRRRYLIGAIAAGLLIVFGLSAIRLRQPVPLPEGTGTPLVADAGSPSSTPIVTTFAPPIVKQSLTAAPGSQRKSPTKHKGGAPAKTKPANTENTEIATDFIPVVYGGVVNLAEGGRMVRVQLPRLAMASFGLPVHMDRVNEKVKADVLVGADGLAQAIRFVQ